MLHTFVCSIASFNKLSMMILFLTIICFKEGDAALGNGGLARLAACQMDSLATLDYPAWGYCSSCLKSLWFWYWSLLHHGLGFWISLIFSNMLNNRNRQNKWVSTFFEQYPVSWLHCHIQIIATFVMISSECLFIYFVFFSFYKQSFCIVPKPKYLLGILQNFVGCFYGVSI